MTVPKHFEEARTTMKRTSFDDSHQVYMTESELPAYDFDVIKDWYEKFRTEKTSEPLNLKSNDALFIDSSGHAYFLEFKNGKLNKGNLKHDLRQKMYDSFFILADRDTCARDVIPSFESTVEYTRENLDYILVYNEAANSDTSSLQRIRTAVMTKAKKPRFGLAQYQGFLYHRVYTVTEKEFQTRFVEKWSKF